MNNIIWHKEFKEFFVVPKNIDDKKTKYFKPLNKSSKNKVIRSEKEISKCIVVEATRFKDKNKKMLYMYDIVKDVISGKFHQIYWGDEGFCCMCLETREKKKIISKEIERIGNAYSYYDKFKNYKYLEV